MYICGTFFALYNLVTGDTEVMIIMEERVLLIQALVGIVQISHAHQGE